MTKSLALPVIALSLLAVAVFGYDSHSEPQDPPNPLSNPEPAVADSDDSTEAKLARAVKNCIIANENYVKLKAENEELKKQLAERRQAANYWYAKAKGQQAKPAVQLDYSFSSGNCANGQCSRGRGRRR